MDVRHPLTAVLVVLLVFTAHLFTEKKNLESELNETIAELNSTNAMLHEANQDISDLSSALDEKTSELEATNELLYNTTKELNDTKDELGERTQELNETRQELAGAITLLNETKDEFLQLKDEVLEIEESVNSSIQWFRDNSVVPPQPVLSSFMNRIESKCIDDNTLNLACIPFVMDLKLDFNYRFEYPDRLYSIEEMVGNKGGDCEDYSLFLKAVLNELREDNLRLKGWESSDDEFIVYETAEEYWYYWGDSHYFGKLWETYPYVICYTTTYSETVYEGHCVVALSYENISSAGDFADFEGSEIFEPQDGKYLGEIGEALAVCMEGQEDCEKRINHINFVIADDDLYQFTEGRWKSYKLYQKSASALHEDIEYVLEEKLQ